jgi:PadR family transcriptional regulator, regulatory protein PadR
MHMNSRYNICKMMEGGVDVKVNKELLKGSTGMLILSLLDQKEMYGYQLIKELERLSEGTFDLKEGTLYPILHGMETEKWLDSYWEMADGRKRKYYRITDQGKRQLQEKKREWQFFSGAVDRVLGEGPA